MKCSRAKCGKLCKTEKTDIEVLVFEKSPHASYGSCGLHYYIEGLVEDPTELIAVPINALRKKRGLDVRVLHEVIGMDTDIFSYITSL